MIKNSCAFALLSLALFVSGCDTPDKSGTSRSETQKPQELNFVDLRDGRNLVPVFVASVSNPDDAFLHGVLLNTDPDYARANKFDQQDAFAGKKARLLKAAAAVKGKMVLVGLTGPLRAEDYDQEAHSYSLFQGHNFFYDQVVLRQNPPFQVRLVFDAPPKKLAAPEAMARAISSVNDGWDNVVLLTAANVVPQACDAVNADWNMQGTRFCFLHLAPIDAVVYVKSRQGGLVKVGSLIFSSGEKPAQPSTNLK